MADDEQPRKRIKLEHTGVTSDVRIDKQLAKERKAGITAYTGPEVCGFSGILKQRYTDFLVNEILPSGATLHLTELQPPHKTLQNGEAARTESANLTDEQKVVETDSKSEAAEDPLEISNDDRRQVVELFGEGVTDQIVDLYRQVLSNPNKRRRDFKTVVSEPMDDRDTRTQAHKLIREVFKSDLETTTGDRNTITVTANPARKKGNNWSRDAGAGRSKGKLGWEELGGEYCHFTLHKENKDTMEVMYYLASSTKQHVKNFQFAGTKDRRAVTVQRCSAFRMTAERLAGFNKSLRGSKVGDFKYEKTALSLGELMGNEFRIVLRDCHFDIAGSLDEEQRLEQARSIVAKAVASLQDRGYINYFGLQRFGSFHITTDEIGKKILQGDLQGAVDLLLGVSSEVLEAAQSNDNTAFVSSDDRARALALNDWRNGKNAKDVLEKLPRRYSAEISLVRHLGTERNGKTINERDWQGALMSIQRNLRLMYVHAYQSLVWNHAAGKRMELYGNKVVEGDLVLIEKEVTTGNQGVDETGEVVILPAAHDKAADAEDQYTRARSLSGEEASSGKYTVFDIVLPLPGYDIIYPSNTVGAFYKEFMASEVGGGLDPHDMRRKWKDISLSGGYRKVLSKPAQGLEWEVRPYTRDLEQMLETDLERLERAEKSDQNGADDVVISSGADSSENRNGVDGSTVGKEDQAEDGSIASRKFAVIIKMKLGSSQYATMALRELMKDNGCKNYVAEYGTSR